MASGHVKPHQAEHMAAPTNAANVKKVLVYSEPSTHGTSRRFAHSIGSHPSMTSPASSYL